MSIPKVFIKEGVQATKAATEAVANLKNAVRKEVITTEKLLRSPASDLFEKKGVMEAEAFWSQPQSFANYARGQYLTEGGNALQQSHKIETKVISKDLYTERGLLHYPGQANECVTYYEKNLLTGKTQEIQLCNGAPYKSPMKNGYGEVHYNPSTGAPCWQEEFLKDASGRQIGTQYTRFADDGKSVISTETHMYDSPYSKIVREYAPDGSYTKKMYAEKNEKKLVALQKYSKHNVLKRAIEFHDGTKNPAAITEYDALGNRSRTQIFDTYGNIASAY